MNPSFRVPMCTTMRARQGMPGCAALATFASALTTLAALAALSGDASAHELKHGHQIQFFPTVASVLPNQQCLVTISGRVFEAAEHSKWRMGLIHPLAQKLKAAPNNPILRQRASYFLSDSNKNTSVKVMLNGQTVSLPPSDEAGFFSMDVPQDNCGAAPITYQSMATAANPTTFGGSATLVPEEGVTVITDMDDTIKDTNMCDAREKEANTFSRPFKAVPGMAALYQRWQQELAPHIHFHVVSAGPWQLHQPLRAFTEAAGFPTFTWDQRSIDLPNIFVVLREKDSPPATLLRFKEERIRAFMTRFPKRHVVLVGDSGEQDPEVYARILAAFPERVNAVFIRNVHAFLKGCRSDDQTARFASLYPGAMAAKLELFTNPAQLPALKPPLLTAMKP